MLEFDGQKLKELRQRRNLKQRELALLVGKQPAHISNYENGVAAPPADVLLDLMSFFQVTPSEIGKQRSDRPIFCLPDNNNIVVF